MEPLASYRDVRLVGKRTFELYPDRLFTRGHVSLKSSFEVNLPLRVLNPDWSRFRIRSGVFRTGMLFALGFPVAGILFNLHAPANLSVLAFSGGLVGIFIMLVTVRKIEYAAFQNTSGQTVLMVARSGPDVRNFDEFVTRLSAQIRLSKTASAAGDAS